MYMNQHRRFNKSTIHLTPPWLCSWIANYSHENLEPRTYVLDPAIGTGNLTQPFESQDQIIGIDTDPSSHIWADHFSAIEFETIQHWPHPTPDLIVCNPPFNGHDSGMMFPEVFARHMIHLFGTSVPIWMIVPHTFRLTGSKSRRSVWLRSGDFNIDMVVALPTDLFDSANVHTELILVNSGHRPSGQPVLAPPD